MLLNELSTKRPLTVITSREKKITKTFFDKKLSFLIEISKFWTRNLLFLGRLQWWATRLCINLGKTMQNKKSSMHFRTTRLCSIWERPKFWEKLQFFEKFFLVILGQKLLFSSDFLENFISICYWPFFIVFDRKFQFFEKFFFVIFGRNCYFLIFFDENLISIFCWPFFIVFDWKFQFVEQMICI